MVTRSVSTTLNIFILLVKKIKEDFIKKVSEKNQKKGKACDKFVIFIDFENDF